MNLDKVTKSNETENRGKQDIMLIIIMIKSLCHDA